MAESTSASSPLINMSLMRKAMLVIRALQHPLRKKMIEFIYQNGPVSVTEIHSHFDLDQSFASHHLAELRKANLVETTRQGKTIFYSVDTEMVTKVQKLAGELDNSAI